MTVSLSIIVKNEENSLPHCLNSVKDLVDEIVVLDTGSTDKTPEIAKEFGAQVYHFEWCNDFSAARNTALKYVTSDWILVLDADETLTSEIIPHIKKAIEQPQYLVINLVRQEIGASQSPYSLISRLFRNHLDIRFSRPYHALIDDSISEILASEPQWEIGYLPQVAILHTGYESSVISKQNKHAKAQVAMEIFLKSHPQDAYVCSKLGALYIDVGKVNEGMELLKRGLACGPFSDEVCYELHYHLAIGYNKLQNSQRAISHYQAAIILPILPMLKLGAYNNLGNLLKTTGDIDGAKNAYLTALAIDPNFVAGHYNLGMTFKALAKYTDAIACYEKAIALNPKYAEAYQNLGVVFLKVGQVQDSLKAFAKAISLHAQQNPDEAKRLSEGLQQMGFLINP
jgi:glycosyltransferase involved in cell wall biosynthesis